MDDRKEVSVFKSIMWCFAILLISFVFGIIAGIFWGFVIAWLCDHIGIVGKILSNNVIYFIFMTLTTADIGRRVAGLLMRLFSGAIEKSRNVGKGFLGSGILLLIYGIISVIICIVGKAPFWDLSILTISLWYLGCGLISEDKM